MRVLVIGSSRGIGAAVVRQLLDHGHRVVGVSRGAGELASIERPELKLIAHDVTALSEIPGVFAAADAWLGGLDAVIYNAGVLPDVGADEFNTEKDLLSIQTNLMGAIAWLNQAAPRFSREGRGVIVGVGSVAGDRGRRPSPAYGASKAGLHSYLESLRNRLGTKGVRVVTIKPGPVDTDMMAGRKMPFMVSAEVAAAAVVRSLTRGPEVVYVAGIWWPIMRLIQHLPSFVMRRLNV